MEIRECMKKNVISIPATASIREAVRLLAVSRIGMLPVVNAENKLVGHLQLRDLLSLVMPLFIRLVEDFDFVHDFGAIEKKRPDQEAMGRPVRLVMQKPIFVDETCGLVRALTILYEHGWYDLPVVDKDGRLVGIASRVDIGVALLKSWDEEDLHGNRQ
jgi:acetoin utilization protein AcuB